MLTFRRSDSLRNDRSSAGEIWAERCTILFMAFRLPEFGRAPPHFADVSFFGSSRILVPFCFSGARTAPHLQAPLSRGLVLQHVCNRLRYFRGCCGRWARDDPRSHNFCGGIRRGCGGYHARVHRCHISARRRICGPTQPLPGNLGSPIP